MELHCTVATPALKLHLIKNKLQTYLESGNPKSLHLLTPSPATYGALKTLLPPADLYFSTYTGVSQSAIIVGTYESLRDAITNGVVNVGDIGVVVCDDARNGGQSAERIFERIKSKDLNIEIVKISISSTPGTTPDPATTTAQLYAHTAADLYPIPPNLIHPSPPPLTSISIITHFLSTLPHRPTSAPTFTTTLESQSPPYTATLHLPNHLPTHLRAFPSRDTHPTLTAAQQSASVEALAALQRDADPLLDSTFRPLPNRMQQHKLKKVQPQVSATMDPWCGPSWADGGDVFRTEVRLQMGGEEEEVVTDMFTPMAVPAGEEITVYWDRTTTWRVIIGGSSRCLDAGPRLVRRAQGISATIFRTVYRQRMETGGPAAGDSRMGFPYLFAPRDWKDSFTSARQINALAAHDKNMAVEVVHDTAARYGGNYIFTAWRPDLHNDPAEDPRYAAVAQQCRHPYQPVLEAFKFPERRDLLHPVAGDATVPTPVYLLPEFSAVEPVPLKYWKLALVLPVVTHRVGIALIAADLQRTLLPHVSLPNIIPAICAPAARESSDYQRLEFLGDLAVKVLVALEVMTAHPNWHEEYVTAAKSLAVSNSRLMQAAVDSDLARWIVTDVFTCAKWRPRFVGGRPAAGGVAGAAAGPAKRQVSGKVLADVVEALVGAAYLDDGLEGALKAVRTFGMCADQTTVKATIESLRKKSAEYYNQRPVRYLSGLEAGLLQYEFRDHALLLEALTHPSHSHSVSVNCGRLMILGDALLDLIVGRELFHINHDHPDVDPLGPVDMTLYKSSVVSGNFLAFLSMGTLNQDQEGAGSFWRYVHLPHEGLVAARDGLQKRYESGLRDSIQQSLDHDPYYPWPALSAFEADSSGKNKYLADMIDAVIAAVYIS